MNDKEFNKYIKELEIKLTYRKLSILDLLFFMKVSIILLWFLIENLYFLEKKKK